MRVLLSDCFQGHICFVILARDGILSSYGNIKESLLEENYTFYNESILDENYTFTAKE